MVGRLRFMLAAATIISLALAACGGSAGPDPTATIESPPPPPTQPEPTPTDVVVDTPTVEPPSGATRVEVTAEDMGGSGDYAFDPDELTFSVGETVEFTITSETEFHTFTVDELGIDQAIRGRETAVVTFTFDEGRSS